MIMNRFFLLVILLSGLKAGAFAQADQASLADRVVAWIAKSEINTLTDHFDANLQMNILDKESFHSKAQAAILVKDFFKEHSVISCELQHKGGAASNLFMIANLKTSKGSFRLSVHFRQVSGQEKITFFSIEPIKVQVK
jgi:hypothetical protein